MCPAIPHACHACAVWRVAPDAAPQFPPARRALAMSCRASPDGTLAEAATAKAALRAVHVRHWVVLPPDATPRRRRRPSFLGR